MGITSFWHRTRLLILIQKQNKTKKTLTHLSIMVLKSKTPATNLAAYLWETNSKASSNNGLGILNVHNFYPKVIRWYYSSRLLQIFLYGLILFFYFVQTVFLSQNIPLSWLWWFSQLYAIHFNYFLATLALFIFDHISQKKNFVACFLTIYYRFDIASFNNICPMVYFL